MSMQRPPLAAQRRRRAQRGFTIVELSVAVAIAGVLLVSAIALVQVVLRQSRANDTVTSVPRVMTQIDKIYSRAVDYTGLTTDVAIGFGAFDGVFTLTGTSPNRNAINTFGYNTLVTPIAAFRGAGPGVPQNTAYVVTYTGIPQASCADIVSSASAAGVRGIVVAGETTAGQSNTNISPSAFTPADITLAGITVADANRGTAPLIGGAVVVKGPGLQGQLDVASMTANAACGTDRSTVSIGLINWK